MKLTEILTESEQQRIDELDFGKAAKAVGKGIGAVAKGVGAVAGVPQGIGRAIKKGYKGAVSTIGGDDETQARPAKAAQPDAQPAQQGGGALSAFAAGMKGQTGNEPAAQAPQSPSQPAAQQPAPTAKGGGVAAQPNAQQVNKQGPAGTAPAQNLSGTAKAAADKTAAATKSQDAAQASQTMYAQVKANIDKLDKKGKQRILQLLQKSLQAPAQPAAAQSPGGSAFGQMANQLTQPEKSSTGGTITKTATGIKHTAKPAAAQAGGQAVKQMATPVQQSGHSTKPSLAESQRSIFVQK